MVASTSPLDIRSPRVFEGSADWDRAVVSLSPRFHFRTRVPTLDDVTWSCRLTAGIPRRHPYIWQLWNPPRHAIWSAGNRHGSRESCIPGHTGADVVKMS